MTMDEIGAEDAVKLCESWAQKISLETSCSIYLFGSAINDEGDQFDSTLSDLDILIVVPDSLAAVERSAIVRRFRKAKHDLEMAAISDLGRSGAADSAASVVVATAFEIRTNIHKSAVRTFFTRNFFYDLVAKKHTFGVPGAGTHTLPDEQRHAAEFVQGIRNKYLAIAANRTGGIDEYYGPDPIPKAFLRVAAQLLPDSPAGKWYDVGFGLEAMEAWIRKRKGECTEYAALHKKISTRRGARGRKQPLSAEDQLLLAETIFDIAKDITLEEMAIFEVRISDPAVTSQDVDAAFRMIKWLIPSALLVDHRTGSLILRVRGPKSGYLLLARLQELDVLAKLLGYLRCEISSLNSDERLAFQSESLQDLIVHRIASWQPASQLTPEGYEAALANFLQNDPHLFHSDSTRNIVKNYKFSNRYLGFRDVDLLIRERDGEKEQEVWIEVSVVRESSQFYRKLERLLSLPVPVIFAVIASKSILSSVKDDIRRAELSSGRVRIVEIPLT